MLFVLALFFLFYFILQLPAVQNWAANKVTTTLSKELNTKVSIKNIKLEFFDKLVLSDFYIEDLRGDTLLYSRQLKANINTNIPKLLNKYLEIQEITLNDAYLNLRRDSGEVTNNLGFIIEHFSSSDSTILNADNEKAPFHLNIKTVYINDFHFHKKDAYQGEELSIKSGKAVIKINELNLPENRLDVASITVDNPTAKVIQYDWVEEEEKEKEDIISPFVATVESFQLGSGKLKVENLRRAPIKLTDDKTLDLNHLQIYDTNINISNFRYYNWEFSGSIDKVNTRSTTGFILEQLEAKDFKVTPRRAQFNDIKVVTPYSNIGDTLIFKYREFPDFREFPDKVLMDVRFQDAIVRVGDIMEFAPGLENNPFFRNNRKEIVKIDGKITGKVNNIKGRDVTIRLGKSTFLKGDFNTRNLMVKDEQYLDLRLDRLVSNMTTLRQIIPNFNVPENFNKLGKIDFKGQFNGFLVDFVAFGDLQTDLGRARLDMRMNLKEGRERAKYAGELSLTDFDLAVWTNNPDFGKVTFVSQVKNGIGITAETVEAEMTAAIQNFTFKGYKYDNLNVEGRIKERFFNGDFKIKDKNLSFDFEGIVDFTRPKPLFNFKADVQKLALKPLNLSKQDLVLAGNINQLYLENTVISDIQGTASISNFSIIKNGIDSFYVDTVSIVSEIDLAGNKRFFVDSDLAKMEMKGTFDLSKIPQTFIQLLDRNFPEFTQRLHIKTDTTKLVPIQKYTFDLRVRDTKNLTRLINPGLGSIQNAMVVGFIDNEIDSIRWDIDVPEIKINTIQLAEIKSYGHLVRNEGDLSIDVLETKIGKKIVISPVKILSIIESDTIKFALNVLSLSNVLDNINLDGLIYPNEEYMELTLSHSSLIFLSDIWTIEEGNYIRVTDNKVEAKDFVLTSEGREIQIYSVGDKGLELNVENFDLDFINEIWIYDKMDFSGGFTLNASAQNIFKLEGLHAYIEADTFKINNDDWGLFRVDAESASIKSRIDAFINLNQEENGRQLLVDGYYNPPNFENNPGGIGTDKNPANYLNLDFNLSNYPMNMLEYLIQNGISNTVGDIDADFKMHGQPKKLVLDGTATVNNAAVTVDYLQSRFFVDKQTLKLSKNLIDASGGFITDSLGNKAFVTGGLIHDYLRNWELDVRVLSDNFLCLNTTEKDNPLYYGKGIGQGNIRFSGSFRSTNIDIVARTGKGTDISIPISYDQDASEVSFIKFKEKKKFSKDGVSIKPSSNAVEGINLTMDLELTQDARMKMIFDEQAGDIIQGVGNGNIKILVPRGLNEFTMYGNYEIVEGKYLFTAMNIVNKPFTVKKGGTIRWSGDPFGADINLDAQYKGLITSPANFIEEYLVGATSDVISLANRPTNVDLTMNLQGELLKPEITFDIDFPDLIGEIKNYVESKMRIVKRNQNELNRQVFGLIVAGQFIPSGSSSGQNVVLGAVGNTLTELLSQQLSIYLTELVSDWLTEDGFITGIDFDIAYNYSSTASIDDEAGLRSSNELQVRLKNYLFNDRVAVLGGVNIDLTNDASSSTVGGGAFYAGDFAIEYFLTDDHQFKVRFYQSTQPDIGGSRRNKTGLGVSFSKEFDTFKEFLAGMKSDTKKLKKKG